jgi:hypothetical protein
MLKFDLFSIIQIYTINFLDLKVHKVTVFRFNRYHAVNIKDASGRTAAVRVNQKHFQKTLPHLYGRSPKRIPSNKQHSSCYEHEPKGSGKTLSSWGLLLPYLSFKY